ncbi:DUF4139 domain-containing protein, partial [Escherichia coli]|nr:DUF4139 domain-containing protein [Escherichia coli]
VHVQSGFIVLQFGTPRKNARDGDLERRAKKERDCRSDGEAVDITLLDQIPVSANSDITVEKMQYDQAQFDAKTGELSWTLKLSGKENVSLPFSYSVKYPKGMHPSGM